MPSIPEGSAGAEDRAVANDYDSFAEAYSAETEANLINGYYARPAILDLAGDVAGRILDVGGGSATTRTCRWPTWAARCCSPTTRSTMSPRPWYCTTWRIRGPHSPSCGACSSPADG